MLSVIPSILTSDINEAKELLTRCESVVEKVSFDIVDGKFADNKTITPDLLEDVETELKMDYQLMVVGPIEWIERCVRGKAQSIIGHVEQMSDQTEFVGKVRKVGAHVGLGVDLKTPLSVIDKEILTDLDVVLLMSVPAGFGGQEFRSEVIEKIKRLSELRKKNKLRFKIHVDGGVTFGNIKDIAPAGADEVSVGRSLFKGDLRENINKFNKLLS